MTILFQRALLLAKLETTFRTDANPVETIVEHTPIDSTADVDDTAESITVTTHLMSTGDGPFQLTVLTGVLPTGLAVATNYWVNVIDANDFTMHLTYAAAVAGTAAIDLTDAVGTFTMTARRSDAFLVLDPDFTADLTVVERENVKPHISEDPVVVARKLANVTFQHEIRGNSITDGTLPAELGTLLRGCGYGEVVYGEAGNTEETIIDDTAVPVNSATGRFTYTKTTGYAGTLPRTVAIVAEGSGGSGTLFTVFSPASGGQAATFVQNQALTDSATFALPESAVITIGTVTTNFVSGDTYIINLAPAGAYYEPISASFESLTLYLYFDGLLHIVTGARGTFTAEGAAGGFGTYSFTFTGDYVAPTDTALPAAPIYVSDDGEPVIPPQIELASMFAAGGQDMDETSAATMARDFNLCAQEVSIDAANNVISRECINAPDSNAGGLIVERTPAAAFNPETELEATHPFWALLSAGSRVVWGFRIGSVQGNVMTVFAPFAQYSEIGYGNRNEIRVYDVNLRLATPTGSGNDELRILFC